MDNDSGKVDEMTISLLYLTTFHDKYGARAQKGMDLDTLDRLYEKGYISDPKSKVKSIVLIEEGERLSEELFFKYFGLE